MSLNLPALTDRSRERYSTLPEPQKRIKARKKRQAAKVAKRVRALTVAGASGLCDRCGIWCGEHGHAHHRIPRSRGGKWTLDNIVYLCPRCHETAHRTGAL